MSTTIWSFGPRRSGTVASARGWICGATTASVGSIEAHALRRASVDDPRRVGDLVVLDQALAQREPFAAQEGVGHAAADEDGLAARQQRLEHLELAGDLGAADDGWNGCAGLSQQPRERIDLALHEEPGDGSAGSA
jgi:hypothetical protein